MDFLQILGSYRLCKGSKFIIPDVKRCRRFLKFKKKKFFFWCIRGKPTVKVQNMVSNYPICGVLLCFKAISCE